MADPRVEYEQRLRRWRERITANERGHLNVSNARLAVAAAIAVLLWLAFVRNAVSPLWLVAGVAGFVALAAVHARVLEQLERSRRAARLYERGLDRLGGRWIGAGRDGERFRDDHPYARDLDLFGRGSLFELLNTARTEAGEATLADWLRSGAGPEEVIARQAAVAELRPALDFREDVAILAAEGEVSRTGSIATWSGLEPVPIPGYVPWLLAGCSGVSFALAVAAGSDAIPWSAVAAWLLVMAAMVRRWRRTLNAVAERIAHAGHDLVLLTGLMRRIETERVTAPRLVALQSALMTSGASASRAIARLTELVSWRESSQHNLLFMPVTLALLVPEQLALAINRWQDRCGTHVADWLRVVGELEALSALAMYGYEHPADPFPALAATGALFSAEELAHPLLPETAAVANDVHLGGDNGLRVIVVSGSNMSGKSTLLRSVGVNAVLALAGGPVRAARLSLSPLVLGATLRIDDSLQAGHSRFYTEILRLRSIVDAARGPVPLLFLLDEILHGTNSHDRRIGAEAVIHALVDAGAIGLVTTHDLALTRLPDRLGAAAANMHFQDRIENGKMVFDYRMRPGVVEHSNALALMRAVGLNV